MLARRLRLGEFPQGPVAAPVAFLRHGWLTPEVAAAVADVVLHRRCPQQGQVSTFVNTARSSSRTWESLAAYRGPGTVPDSQRMTWRRVVPTRPASFSWL